MAGKFFHRSTEQRKTCMFGESPSSFSRDQLEEKKTPSLHLSPGKIDVDEALGVITGKLDSKICS